MNFKKSQKHFRRFERKHSTKQISVLEYQIKQMEKMKAIFL